MVTKTTAREELPDSDEGESYRNSLKHLMKEKRGEGDGAPDGRPHPKRGVSGGVMNAIPTKKVPRRIEHKRRGKGFKSEGDNSKLIAKVVAARGRKRKSCRGGGRDVSLDFEFPKAAIVHDELKK